MYIFFNIKNPENTVKSYLAYYQHFNIKKSKLNFKDLKNYLRLFFILFFLLKYKKYICIGLQSVYPLKTLQDEYKSNK